jgi:hypothetical protein
MAEHRIEAITRHLATELGRRRFGVGAATSLVATMLVSRPALACKKVGRKCDKNKDCCDHAKCKGDKKDKKGKCRCKSGYKECNKRCYDLDKDPQNCGSCGNACVPPDACCDGQCNTTCVR